MGVKYDKLWELLKKQGLNKTYLRENGIHPTSIAKMGRNVYVDLKVLSRICDIMHCDYGDLLEYTQDSNDNDQI